MPTQTDAQTNPLDVLAHHRVLRLLGQADHAAFVAQAENLEMAAGATVFPQGHLGERLALITHGAVDLQDPDLEWHVRLEPGEWFGAGVTPLQQQADWQAVATETTLLLCWPLQAVLELCHKHPQIAVFFPLLPNLRRDATLTNPSAGSKLNLLSTPVRTLVKREPLTVAPGLSIHATATLMRDQHVSSVLLIEQGYLFGVVTDRDLRNRVVAQGLNILGPIADIATLAPLTLQAGRPAFEALLLMARHNIHHIPVMEGQRIVGMITATDLTEQHGTSAVYLVGDINKQRTVEDLVNISAKVKTLQQHLAAADASAYSTGHIITVITDAITVRLIQLAETKLGPAPVDYVWVAAGSQARSEQTAKSDQDNCLILEDSFDPARHGAYFEALTRFVCDGLAACGYVHCPGEIMAKTETWRQPRRRWVRYFEQWTNVPEPKALMLTCVFFDLRAVFGAAELLDSLRRQVLQSTRGNTLFLANMVSNALKHSPPLSLFGNIALIRGGDHAGTIDLKHNGLVPIVDLARVYALSGAIDAINTHDRLELASQSGEISEQRARDLRDALEFLGKLRIAHQARQITCAQAPDNFLALEEISNFERSHLKEAFAVMQSLQSVLGQRYQAGRF